MDNFIYDIPTKLYFGRGQIAHLPELVKAKGRRVLLVYGGGSIKKIGLYDTILELLSDCQILELPGVEPNPRIESVRQEATNVYSFSTLLGLMAASASGTFFPCKL